MRIPTGMYSYKYESMFLFDSFIWYFTVKFVKLVFILLEHSIKDLIKFEAPF